MHPETFPCISPGKGSKEGNSEIIGGSEHAGEGDRIERGESCG